MVSPNAIHEKSRHPIWHNRRHAGQALAQQLRSWRGRPQALVVGLPRGGIVVAAEVASQLQLPLASWTVRKLADPRAPELALGAMAPGGVLIWDEANATAFGLDALQRQRIEAEQRRELERRQQLYGDPPLAALRHRPLLVVDDGVATGLTVRAALESLRQAEPNPLVLAVPVIDQRVAAALRLQLDGLVALAEVDDLWTVGAWYQRFEPVSDRDVLRLMAAGSGDQASNEATALQREKSDPF
jgi:putative phosphoribosyl transferase